VKDPSDHGKKPSTATALGSGHLPGSTEYFQLSLPVLVTNLLVQILKVRPSSSRVAAPVFNSVF